MKATKFAHKGGDPDCAMFAVIWSGIQLELDGKAKA